MDLFAFGFMSRNSTLLFFIIINYILLNEENNWEKNIYTH